MRAMIPRPYPLLATVKRAFHRWLPPNSGRNSWHDSSYAQSMPDDSPTIGLRVVESLSAVEAEQWDACALAPGSAGNPFLSHRFLKALEDSKSVGRRLQPMTCAPPARKCSASPRPSPRRVPVMRTMRASSMVADDQSMDAST